MKIVAVRVMKVRKVGGESLKGQAQGVVEGFAVVVKLMVYRESRIAGGFVHRMVRDGEESHFHDDSCQKVKHGGSRA